MYSIHSESSSTIVVRTVLSNSPHSPCTFLQLEFTNSLTKSKDSLWRKSEVHLDIFVQYYKSWILGCNEHIGRISWICKWEVEGVKTSLESEHIQSHWLVIWRLRNCHFWNFESWACSISKCKVSNSPFSHSHREGQVLDEFVVNISYTDQTQVNAKLNRLWCVA